MVHLYFVMILSSFSHWHGLERIFQRIELKFIAKYKITTRRKALEGKVREVEKNI